MNAFITTPYLFTGAVGGGWGVAILFLVIVALLAGAGLYASQKRLRATDADEPAGLLPGSAIEWSGDSFMRTVEQRSGASVSACLQCHKCSTGCPVGPEADFLSSQNSW